MTPDTYLNAYRSYKAGTNRITTWLVELLAVVASS